MLFDARIDIGEGADGAGDRASGDFRAGIDEALAVAVHLGIKAGEGQAHGGRLGMDAVAAADAHRVLVFEGAGLQCSEYTVHIGEQQIGGADELDVERGVQHVRRGHALVNETAVGADKFGKVRQESDDVVLGDGLDLVDAGDIEGGAAALFPDRLCCRFRNDAEFGKRVTGMRLDLEPDAELRFRRPDGDHFRSGVTRDHGNDFLSGGILGGGICCPFSKVFR